MSQTKAQLVDGKSATIQFTGGSAASPAVSFTGDTNTGIYSPGADQVAISTGGTGRLFVDANGRVLSGAGTAYSAMEAATMPDSALQIAGSDASYRALRYGADLNGPSFFFAKSYSSTVGSHVAAVAGANLGSIFFNGSNGTQFARGAQISAVTEDAVSGTSCPTYLAFRTCPSGGGITERLRITSDGKVGLGTSSPGTVLHCAINSSATSIATSPSTAFFQNLNATSGAVNSLLFVNSGGFGSASIYTTQTQTGNSGDNLVLTTKTSGGAWNTGVVVDTAGRLGVGTTSPQGILAVSDGTVTGEINPFSASSTCFIGTRSNHSVSFQIAASEKARIDTSGRLLVGTSSGSALLQVNGTFRAGDQATSGMSGNNATILSATPPSGALAAEIHCFGKDYSTAGANNHVGLLVAYWSADTNTINTTTNINNSTGANQGFEVIWSSPNLVVRNKTGMSANQSARAWIRWLA